ncbi:hypothetical protein [Vibrio fluminensis]|uniref:hypothetical protein n=1 Tax=Vibrio fluminensis TaxID=2783614 RepID=UPI001887D2B5|nr:hypothetical protein [Vibrio fluminensis]
MSNNNYQNIRSNEDFHQLLVEHFKIKDPTKLKNTWDNYYQTYIRLTENRSKNITRTQFHSVIQGKFNIASFAYDLLSKEITVQDEYSDCPVWYSVLADSIKENCLAKWQEAQSHIQDEIRTQVQLAHERQRSAESVNIELEEYINTLFVEKENLVSHIKQLEQELKIKQEEFLIRNHKQEELEIENAKLLMIKDELQTQREDIAKLQGKYEAITLERDELKRQLQHQFEQLKEFNISKLCSSSDEEELF